MLNMKVKGILGAKEKELLIDLLGEKRKLNGNERCILSRIRAKIKRGVISSVNEEIGLLRDAEVRGIL